MKIYYEALISRLMKSGLSEDQAIELLRLAMEDLIIFADDNQCNCLWMDCQKTSE